jgi:hypothetical protein
MKHPLPRILLVLLPVLVLGLWLWFRGSETTVDPGSEPRKEVSVQDLQTRETPVPDLPEPDVSVESSDPVQDMPDPIPESASADVFERTRAWLAGLEAGEDLTPEERAVGEPLLRERRGELLALMESDAEAAFRQALTDEERSRVPAELRGLVEEPLRTRGDLLLGIACSGYHEPGAHPESEMWREALVNGKPMEAHTFGYRKETLSLENVALDGYSLDGQAVVYQSPLRLLRPGDSGFVPGEVRARFGGQLLTFSTPDDFAEAQTLALDAELNSDGPRVTYPDFLNGDT